MILLFLMCAGVSLLLSVLIIRWARAHARHYGQHHPQRFHIGDVPRIGGVALLLATLWGWGWMASPWQEAAQMPPGGRLLFVWGALAVLPAVLGGIGEDLTQRLTVRWRLLMSVLTAVLAVWWLDLRVDRLGLDALDAGLAAVPVLGLALALLAIAGLPHAFNIIDGYNGLASMVALVVCAALAHVALQVGDRALAGFLVSVMGATVGFMVWNYPRGMIFAGDGGAYLWGGSIAIACLALVLRHEQVSPWFPMLLLMYPVWETLFSMYRKSARGVSPGVADALHFHQLIYRRIVRSVFHDDEARRMLMRNNRTSPYLWGFTVLTAAPALLFWRNTPVLMAFCALFVCTYVGAYLMIVRFKVPPWLRH